MEIVRRPRVEGVKLTAAGVEEPIVGGTLVVTAFFFIYSTRKQAGQDELIVCRQCIGNFRAYSPRQYVLCVPFIDSLSSASPRGH